tara:strand:+ start:54 stop:494 length:441 start_codon:yes stop_codon:yes gene_type:complete
MALYGRMRLTAYNYSSTSGLTISNANNNTSGLQSGWSDSGDITLEPGSYLLCATYSPSSAGGEFPNNDEDPFEMAYSLGGTWQSDTFSGLESNPHTYLKTGQRVWAVESTSNMTVKIGIRKGTGDTDSGGTTGRLHWTILRIADYA